MRLLLVRIALDTVNGAILTAGIGRLLPLVARAAIGTAGVDGIAGLPIARGRIDSLRIIVPVQGRVGLLSGTKPVARIVTAIIVCIAVSTSLVVVRAGVVGDAGTVHTRLVLSLACITWLAIQSSRMPRLIGDAKIW